MKEFVPPVGEIPFCLRDRFQRTNEYMFPIPNSTFRVFAGEATGTIKKPDGSEEMQHRFYVVLTEAEVKALPRHPADHPTPHGDNLFKAKACTEVHRESEECTIKTGKRWRIISQCDKDGHKYLITEYTDCVLVSAS